MSSFVVVIPARYGSTRLPGKALLDIGGRPMVQRVVEQCCRSAAAEVLVATDDARIAAAVHDPRRPKHPIAILTDPALPSGTDRVSVVASARGWSEDTIVVNVQGDEPFIPPALIDRVAAVLAADPAASIATLATPIDTLEHFLDPNVVKVALAHDGAALYFSRAPIPWNRDAALQGLASQSAFAGSLRHIGLYAYRVGALRRLIRLTPTALETLERLEQLRALEHGLRIVVDICAEPPTPGIDTAADLARVRALPGV